MLHTKFIFALSAFLASQAETVFARPNSTPDTIESDAIFQIRRLEHPGSSFSHIDRDVGSPENTILHARSTKPFYAIAHRVLTVDGVKDACTHGANAIEIDFTAWPSGWYADHDGSANSAGGTARDVLQAVADQRTAGKPVTFVWFDIKDADYCDADDPTWEHCSVIALRDLAREILQPVGVRALYGFYGTSGQYNAYSRIADGVNSNEAVNLDGSQSYAQQGFDSAGPAAYSQRIYSWGDDTISNDFAGKVSGLETAVTSGKFGKVFSWTTRQGDAQYVNQLLDPIKVDGIIYGHGGANYDDSDNVKSAFKDLTSAVNSNSGQYHLATSNDNPW